MALINCPWCGRQVSNLAHHCPGCGKKMIRATEQRYMPLKESKTKNFIVSVGIALLILAILFAAYKNRFAFDRVVGTWKSVWYEYEYGTLSLSTLSEWNNRDKDYYKETLKFHSDGTLTNISGDNNSTTYYWKNEGNKYYIYHDKGQNELLYTYAIEERDGRKVLVWKLETNQNMVYSKEDIQVEDQIDYNKIAAQQNDNDIPYRATGQGSGTGSTEAPSNNQSSSSSTDLGSSGNSILNDEEEDYEEDTGEADEGNYIFPNSDTSYLSKSDLKGMTKSQINLAKNELYARHGRMFQREDLQEYFDGCSWYTPRYSPEEWDEYGDSYFFNEYEIANRNLLNKQEKKK